MLGLGSVDFESGIAFDSVNSGAAGHLARASGEDQAWTYVPPYN